ncbi:MAG: PTS fructose transporter subunit IIB [Acholeplasmataceae bacterium]
MKKIVAVTACPTGIAHTYMAAELLELTAKKMNVLIKVETQGAIGIENALTDNDIDFADIVLLACDIQIDEKRFIDKKIFRTTTTEVIAHPKVVIANVLQKI